MGAIQTSEEDGYTRVTLDRPAKKNALTPGMLEELRETLNRLRGEIDMIVLTGAGDAFSAGADLAAFQEMDGDEAEHVSRTAGQVTRMLSRGPYATIAAINGACLGGGHELALACDIRVAATDAVLGQPEVAVGLTPGFGATARLPRLIGGSRARELLLTGKTVGAEEAERIGLVHRVADDAVAAAEDVVEDLNGVSPLAYRRTKQLLWETGGAPMHTAVEAEQDVFGEMFGSHDTAEGIAAFLEKREPDFTGE